MIISTVSRLFISPTEKRKRLKRRTFEALEATEQERMLRRIQAACRERLDGRKERKS
jgi:hypothetical protein